MTVEGPVHLQVLQAARRGADRAGAFKLRSVVAELPHLNAGTVRTHVASRCCVNAPAHHATRWPYFRSLGHGTYRIERRAPTGGTRRPRRRGWQDRIIEALPSSIDPTLIAMSLQWTPTERLEHMRSVALSLNAMRGK